MSGALIRTLSAGAAVGRDLLRRRGALALLSALPAAFYLSVVGEEIPEGAEPWTLYVGTIGIAWAVAGGAFFLALAARRIDPRLLLAGYSRIDLMTGRLIFLLGFATVITAIYTVLLTLLSGASWGPLALAVGSTGVTAVALGLALAALLPRELEGTIALVLIVGVQSSVPLSSPAAPYLPFYGAMQLVDESWSHDGPDAAWIVRTVITAVALLVLAWVGWTRTTYARRNVARITGTPEYP